MTEKANTEMQIEQKKWYKNTIVIIGLISAFVGAIYGVIQIFESSLFKPKKILTNIEIILDSSASMNESFDGSIKWEAAVKAVEKNLILISNSDNLSFRKFGGNCESSDNTKLVVPFGVNNKTAVMNILSEKDIKGKTTLVEAIVAATGDFNNSELFSGDDVLNSIIVITGGGDLCNPNPAWVISKRLRDRFEVSFQLIGMGLSDKQKSDFKENFKTKEDVDVVFADTHEELQRVFEDSLVEAHAPSTQTDDTTNRDEEIIQPEHPNAITKFRYTSKKIINKETVKSMLIEQNFFCEEYYSNKEYCNPSGSGFDNNFEKKNNGQVVYDHASGLTWQQSGSDHHMTYDQAEAYLAKLNSDQFAGHNDWRLPTLEEAMSLMETSKKNGMYIDQVFDSTQLFIWTADAISASIAWTVFFNSGYCFGGDFIFNYVYVRAVR